MELKKSSPGGSLKSAFSNSCWNLPHIQAAQLQANFFGGFLCVITAFPTCPIAASCVYLELITHMMLAC